MNDNEIIVIKTIEATSRLALDERGNNYWDQISSTILERAIEGLNGKTTIMFNPAANEWQRVQPENLSRRITDIRLKMGRSILPQGKPTPTVTVNKQYETVTNDDGAGETPISEEISIVHNTPVPKNLIINNIYWKALIRNVIRGENALITGPSGTGKTKAVKEVAQALNRPLCIIPLGNAQSDPKTLLIGNTGYDSTKGTFFAKSAFAEAIQTPNTIILLDEISRPNPEAWNILLPVLDKEQKTLRLDDMPGSPVIEVHPTVSFFATANIGIRYTATKVLDMALTDRIDTEIEFSRLTDSQELTLLKLHTPNVEISKLNTIVQIADNIRKSYASSNTPLDNDISTRTTKAMASLVSDGFSVVEACEVCLYTKFSEGEARSYAKQIVQKLIPPTNVSNSLFNTTKHVAKAVN